MNSRLESPIMTFPRDTDSYRVRQSLDHPVVDTDGHMLEFAPAMNDFVRTLYGPDLATRLEAALKRNRARYYGRSDDERRAGRLYRPPFWVAPTKNTLDRATAMLPKLMAERLETFGIDFGIVYPTTGFTLPEILAEDDLRRAACRAHNTMVAELFKGVEARLTPAAAIPCQTPDEAIAEIEHCVRTLGYKVVMLSHIVRRPVEAVAHLGDDVRRQAQWFDALALDSAYDYDPLWAKCLKLGVAVTAHGQTQGLGLRRSYTNYMYNQTGHFAEAGHTFAKALFFGGVTRRFPDLNFAFLEGGVTFGVTLYGELMERWQKRGRAGVERNNPALLDVGLLSTMFDRYGGDLLKGRLAAALYDPALTPTALTRASQEDADRLDDFAAAGIAEARDIYRRFVPRFFYGCEADDALVSLAFKPDWFPFQPRFNAMLGSDIGHWDVPDMTHVLSEAHELVEHGHLTTADFREFTFGNAVRLHAEINPDFFRGTVVEAAAAAHMKNQAAHRAA
jgi:predicted TIM-barrel fold metal-dependent hydrolase